MPQIYSNLVLCTILEHFQTAQKKLGRIHSHTFNQIRDSLPPDETTPTPTHTGWQVLGANRARDRKHPQVSNQVAKYACYAWIIAIGTCEFFYATASFGCWFESSIFLKLKCCAYLTLLTSRAAWRKYANTDLPLSCLLPFGSISPLPPPSRSRGSTQILIFFFEIILVQKYKTK